MMVEQEDPQAHRHTKMTNIYRATTNKKKTRTYQKRCSTTKDIKKEAQ